MEAQWDPFFLDILRGFVVQYVQSALLSRRLHLFCHGAAFSRMPCPPPAFVRASPDRFQNMSLGSTPSRCREQLLVGSPLYWTLEPDADILRRQVLLSNNGIPSSSKYGSSYFAGK